MRGKQAGVLRQAEKPGRIVGMELAIERPLSGPVERKEQTNRDDLTRMEVGLRMV